MEDILQSVSNEHQSIYYGVQLKIMDISKSLKLKGIGITENELKTATAEMLNHFYMLETIFQESRISHIYQLIKSINLNYNSVIAILLDKVDRAILKEINLNQIISNKGKEVDPSAKVEEGAINSTNLLKEIKKNHLGGVHLFNQHYSRYIQDQKILEQIKVEKQRRLQRKRMDILRESIMEELQHQTDVEQFPAKNDDIANYLIRVKDKNSMFNYVSYEPELQNILTFFQNSQKQANDFLMKRARNISEENETKFSFADFQRDIQLKNSIFKRQVVDKLKDFTEKYRNKEKELIEYLEQKEQEVKLQRAKSKKICEAEVQTDLNFNIFMDAHEQRVKDLEEKCLKLEYIRKTHFQSGDKENSLLHQLASKETEVQKLSKKINELEISIDYVKQLLREEKLKKISGNRQDLAGAKSQKTIPQPLSVNQNSEKAATEVKQNIGEQFSRTQEMASSSSPSNDSHPKKPSSMTNKYWRKKEIVDTASFLSFHDLEKDKNGKQVLKPERNILVSYQAADPINEVEGQRTQINLPAQSQRKKQSIDLTLTQQKIIQIKKDPKIVAKEQRDEKKAPSVKSIKGEPNDSQKVTPINTSKSLRNQMEGELISSRKSLKKILSESYNSITKSKNTVPSLKKIKFEQKQIKNVPVSSEAAITKDKSQPNINQSEKQAQMPIHLTDNLKPELTSECTIIDNEKREQLTYQMYEVAEEGDEEQTIKQSSKNSRNSSLKSFQNKETQLMQKLNFQLKKIKENPFTHEHLYSFAIYPQLRPVQTLQIPKNERIPTDVSSSYRNDQGQGKVMKLFDNLLKIQGTTNPAKAEKIKNWRKVMLNHLKSETISQNQVDQIMSVIRGSSLWKDQKPFLDKGSNSLASISTNFRNSITETQSVRFASPHRVKLPNVKKIKARNMCDQSETALNKSASHCIILTQIQQKIEDLIKFESLQQSFPDKFNDLHRNCCEGPLCTHISKYFETIMRYYDLKKKKQRKSILLPVQSIGNRSKVQEQANQKENKLLKSNKSDTHNRKNYSLNNYRYSQQIILPSINEYKSNALNFKSFKMVV